MNEESYKVYLSGAITGRARNQVEKEFADAESLWQAIGVTVLNPLNNGLSPNVTWREHMCANAPLLWNADAIFLMPGWEDSRGCQIELITAHKAGMAVFYAESGLVDQDTFVAINDLAKPVHVHTLIRIAHAVEAVTQVSLAQIQESKRTREQVYARMIFVWECRKSMPLDTIVAVTKNKGTSIRYFLRKFEDEYRYNPEFAFLADKVTEIIEGEDAHIAEFAPKRTAVESLSTNTQGA